MPIEATGATFRSYISNLDFDQVAEMAISQNDAGYLLTAGEQMLRECRSLLPQILEDLHGERPDGIIYDQTALWGRMLAQILHTPAIIVRPGYASNAYFKLFSILTPPASPPVLEEMNARLAYLNAQLHTLCAEYSIPAFDLTDISTHAEPLTLVTLPRTFQYAGETFDARFQFVGPCILPRYNGSDFPLERLRKQPTLYISLGTSFNEHRNFYQTCLSAFADTPWQVVMALGKHSSPADLGPVPDNFIVHPYVPQLDVLARSSIFISHGGMNSIMEALSYGVPLIIIPQLPEQELTARRVVELDLG
ncbi:hypothetical protein KDK_77990 [Dictyobacter kobayashii]|uniref:UDP-glycosyltransferases domain-containing protein n=1 Tax=Dictyobacter kobayashii TaxID=2014872 RepID=A0A402AY37_9CHLR|nr:hypothetical protein KDK_77990 [Dictyobacter kobayashii]